MLRLYTFNISHFSEKARWALDYEGIAYEEKVLLPGPHQLVTRRIARKAHVPVLEHDGHCVQGSSAILDYIGSTLGGSKLKPKTPEAVTLAQELEQQADLAFGLGVQRILYSEMLQDRRAITELWADGGPSWARGFYALAYPIVAAVVKQMYKTADPGAVAEAKDRFVKTMDELDAVLEKQRYLGGEAPSRSDITVAALLAPVCRPPQHRVKWPEIPVALQSFEAQLRGRRTWDHVLAMYRDHRAG